MQQKKLRLTRIDQPPLARIQALLHMYRMGLLAQRHSSDEDVTEMETTDLPGFTRSGCPLMRAMCTRSSQSTSSVAETQVSVGTAPAKLISLHCCLPNTVFPRFRNGQRIAALQLKARGRDALGEAAMPWVDREHQVEALEHKTSLGLAPLLGKQCLARGTRGQCDLLVALETAVLLQVV